MKRKPNVLIIHADQHRYDCIGAYGNDTVMTPNIDVLAKDGINYTNNYCSYPVCTPSRYSFLSGLYVNQHGGWTNHSTLPEHISTFPKVMRDNGYSTAAVGKMHFTPTYLDVGFDRMQLCEQNGPGRWDDDYHRYLWSLGLYDRNDLEGEVKEYRDQSPPKFWDTLSTYPSNLPQEHHSTTWIGDRAVEEIELWNDEGNLLMVGFVKPHHPFDPSAPWSDMYDTDEIELLPGWTDTCFDHDLEMHAGFFPHDKHTVDKVKQSMAYYYSAISHIDHEVGRMLALLKKKGVYDNTIIVYTSDHGDYMGYHHLMLKGNYMYEPLAKIPLIIKHVGSCRASTVDNALVSNVDMAATLLHLTGLDKPLSMGGVNIETESRKYAVAENKEGKGYMICDGRYKLMLYQNDDMSQFFDLHRDPYEMENKYNSPEYNEQIAGLKNELLSWSLFKSKTAMCVNEYAKIIAADNAQEYDEVRRDDMKAYYRQKMKGFK